MKEYGVARNTVRDFLGLCKLKIIDMKWYQTVVKMELEKSGKSSVCAIELHCRSALRDYRAKANRFKDEKKLLPFYLKEEFYSANFF